MTFPIQLSSTNPSATSGSIAAWRTGIAARHDGLFGSAPALPATILATSLGQIVAWSVRRSSNCKTVLRIPLSAQRQCQVSWDQLRTVAGLRRPPPGLAEPPCLRQRSEQYLTCSQSRSHFLRQKNERPHPRQIFEGSFSLWWVMAGSKADIVECRGHLGIHGLVSFARCAAAVAQPAMFYAGPRAWHWFATSGSRPAAPPISLLPLPGLTMPAVSHPGGHAHSPLP